jgi:hypothetical protein
MGTGGQKGNAADNALVKRKGGCRVLGRNMQIEPGKVIPCRL